MKTKETKAKESAVPMPPKDNGPTLSSDERKWRAEDDMRTMMKAEEIRADRRRMADVDACRRDKMRQMANIEIKVEKSPRTMKAMK